MEQRVQFVVLLHHLLLLLLQLSGSLLADEVEVNMRVGGGGVQGHLRRGCLDWARLDLLHGGGDDRPLRFELKGIFLRQLGLVNEVVEELVVVVSVLGVGLLLAVGFIFGHLARFLHRS